MALSWDEVIDPESGILSHGLWWGGSLLTEVDPANLSYLDQGDRNRGAVQVGQGTAGST